MSIGIQYIAVGQECLSECKRSYYSLRRHCPDMPVAVYTDQPDHFSEEDDLLSLFLCDLEPSIGTKVELMSKLPFDYTVYLDCDTVILSPSAFDPSVMLTPEYGYEVMYVHAESRRYSRVAFHGVPCMNSGVLMLRKCARIRDTLKDWDEQYKNLSLGDEVLLTRLLLQRGVPSFVLPCEWNYRNTRPHRVQPDHLKIVHDHRLNSLVQIDGSIDPGEFESWWHESVEEVRSHNALLRLLRGRCSQ